MGVLYVMLVGCEERPKDIKHPIATLKDDRKVLLEDNGTWECIVRDGVRLNYLTFSQDKNAVL